MRTFGKLREKIKAEFKTMDTFAEAMGMHRSTLSNKLNSLVGWKQSEIEKACMLLEIPMEEVSEYFFYS